ncbi:hypothetical protein L1987_33104 [Smallanthus sonchifolius]|uniref:Uncharacterized protein n=1 Tax=Smallanthus sonchifolius TaxID=185202 RepID=A0ACB9HRT6_9ASTR|nr:hypothetical protein L1987_33104 [Smallanthus sonchifolius]
MKRSSTRGEPMKRIQKVEILDLRGMRRWWITGSRHSRNWNPGPDCFGLRAMRRAIIIVSRVRHLAVKIEALGDFWSREAVGSQILEL